MAITFGLILACYVFYLIIKWSIKFFLLLLVIVMGLGFFYKIDFKEKIMGTSKHVQDAVHPTQKK